MFVAIFSAIKVFTWIATLYGGSITFNTPMLYFFGFLFLFVFGGMTGVAVATQSLDVHWHDTYFVVAHFHFIMVGGTLTAFLAAAHYWFPKMFGRMYSERVGLLASRRCSSASSSRSSRSSCSATPACRAATTAIRARYQWLHVLSTGGACLLARRARAHAREPPGRAPLGTARRPNPWGSRSFEWLTPSPPPKHNFAATAGHRRAAPTTTTSPRRRPMRERQPRSSSSRTLAKQDARRAPRDVGLPRQRAAAVRRALRALRRLPRDVPGRLRRGGRAQRRSARHASTRSSC